MKKIIDELFNLFSKNNLNKNDLNKEISSLENIEKLFSSLDLNPFNELKAIYNRFKGFDHTRKNKFETTFFFTFYLVSMESAIYLYQEQCLDFENWEKPYFPLLWNGNDLYILVNTLDIEDSIYLFDFHSLYYDIETKTIIFDSFKSMILTFIEYFALINAGTININDFRKFAKIAMNNNPKSIFWESEKLDFMIRYSNY
jgi:hypothetical protein